MKHRAMNTAADWAVFARTYRAAYREKHVEAAERGLSRSMADYVAQQHATRVAVRASGIADASASARET